MDQFIGVDVNLDGMRRKFRSAITVAAQPERVLKRIAGLLRKRAQERIRAGGPGWQPLAESTVARKPTMAHIELLAIVRGKGARSRSSRIRRQGVLKFADQMERYIALAARAKTPRMQEKNLRLAMVRAEVLTRIALRFGGVAKLKSASDLVEFAEKDLLTRARRRAGFIGAPRYRATEKSTRLMGGLIDSIGFQVEGAVARVTSRTARGWSEVHNEGGVAGHGARMPQREYLTIEDSDLDFAEEVAAEELARAFD